jgi:hypothetical protein
MKADPAFTKFHLNGDVEPAFLGWGRCGELSAEGVAEDLMGSEPKAQGRIDRSAGLERGGGKLPRQFAATSPLDALRLATFSCLIARFLKSCHFL